MSSLARRPLPPRAVSLLTLALTAAALVACSPRYFANQSGRTVKPTITVGSTNFSDDSWTLQENNIITLRSQALAALYRKLEEYKVKS